LASPRSICFIDPDGSRLRFYGVRATHLFVVGALYCAMSKRSWLGALRPRPAVSPPLIIDGEVFPPLGESPDVIIAYALRELGCPGSICETNLAAAALASVGIRDKSDAEAFLDWDWTAFPPCFNSVSEDILDFLRGGARKHMLVCPPPFCNSSIAVATRVIDSFHGVKTLQCVSSGPLAACRILRSQQSSGEQAQCLAEQARLEALCGGSLRCLREVKSVLKCWSAFSTCML
jgi:hypothetical protein